MVMAIALVRKWIYRLGYTYDWGSLKTEAGASEFVIRKGAEVEVESVTKTIDYVRGK